MKKFLIVLVLLSCVFCSANEVRLIPLYIGSQKFTVEVADTPEKREMGLMYRESVPGNYGMIFIFEEEDYQSFWMKNCKISLDIIYLDSSKQVVDIHASVPPCKKDTCPSYMSRKPAQFVLELRANRAKEINLKPGDFISFSLPK